MNRKSNLTVHAALPKEYITGSGPFISSMIMVSRPRRTLNGIISEWPRPRFYARGSSGRDFRKDRLREDGPRETTMHLRRPLYVIAIVTGSLGRSGNSGLNTREQQLLKFSIDGDTYEFP